MSVTKYSSTDSGSPVLNGTPGNGIANLLTTCLTGTGTAYGSLPKKGWTLLFSGANKCVLRTVDGFAVLRIVHDGSGTGGFREALVRAGEAATDVDTLVDPFPTVAEVSDANCVWRATDTLDTTARAWELVADENWFILSVQFGTSAADMYIFGRYSPSRSANSWPYVINTRGSANSGLDSSSACQMAYASFSPSGAARLYAMRTVDGVTKSPRAGLVTESGTGGSATFPGGTGPQIPNNDGLIFMSPPQVWVNTGAGGTLSNPQSAGFFPNLWSPLHAFSTAAGRAVVYGDTFSAAAYDPSAAFVFRGPRSDANGKWIVETTDTWQDPLA